MSESSPLGGCEVQFRYQVIRLWEVPHHQLLSAGVGMLPLVPLSDVQPTQMPGVVRQMEQRFNQDLTPAEAGEFWTATHVLMGLRYNDDQIATLLEGVLTKMKESTTYQAILKEGRDEGRDEGRITGMREALLHLATKRFGEPPSPLRSKIEAIENIEQLDALILRVIDAEDWNDLLDPQNGDEQAGG